MEHTLMTRSEAYKYLKQHMRIGRTTFEKAMALGIIESVGEAGFIKRYTKLELDRVLTHGLVYKDGAKPHVDPEPTAENEAPEEHVDSPQPETKEARLEAMIKVVDQQLPTDDDLYRELVQIGIATQRNDPEKWGKKGDPKLWADWVLKNKPTENILRLIAISRLNGVI